MQLDRKTEEVGRRMYSDSGMNWWPVIGLSVPVLLAVFVMHGWQHKLPVELTVPQRAANPPIMRFAGRAGAQQAYKRGCVLMTEQKYRQAIKYFRQALSVDPDFIMCYHWLGYCELWSDQWQQSVEDYSKAIAGGQLSYYDRALAYEKLGQYGKAAEDYRMAIASTPGAPVGWKAGVHGNCAREYEKLGDNQRAIDEYTEAIKLDKNVFWYGQRAHAYEMAGQYGKAIDDYNMQLQLKSALERWAILAERAQVYEKMGDNEKALADFSSALSQKGWHPASLYNARARIYDKLGKTDLARQDRERAQPFRR